MKCSPLQLLVLLAIPALILAMNSSASANLIVNGSFESPVITAGQTNSYNSGSSSITGWSVVGNQTANVLLVSTTYSETPPGGSVLFNAQSGSQSLDITGIDNKGFSAGVKQSVTTTIGAEYFLGFYLGRATPSGGPDGAFATAATIDLSIDGGSRISFTNSDITNGMVNWKYFTHSFIASGTSTEVRFLNGTELSTREAGLDNVSLVAVPEPSTFAGLVLLSTCSLIGYRCQRRHRRN
jgi:hypothetical protein